MKIQIDVDYMLSLPEEKRRVFSSKLLDLERYARRKVDEGKLSKIMANRILHLCMLIPPKNKNRFSIPFYKKESQFSYKDKKKMIIALNKLNQIRKNELLEVQEG